MAGRGLIIFCALISIVLLPTSRSGKCPVDSELVSIDLDKFSGEWYMVAGTSISGQAGKCLHFQVDKESEGKFRMNFSSTSYRNNKRIWWNVKGTQSGKNLPATWQLNGSPRKIGPFEHQIIEIDYASYSVMVVCAPNTQYIPKQNFSMILAREKTLGEPTLSNLKTKISEYIDKNDILDIDNTCTEIDT